MAIYDRLHPETERLLVAIDAVVPADDFPSASQAGGLRFWSQVTASERPWWSDRATAVLDLLDRSQAEGSPTWMPAPAMPSSTAWSTTLTTSGSPIR